MFSSAPQDYGQPLVLEDFIHVEQSVIASPPPLCAVCHTTMTDACRCSRCQNIRYCSSLCQALDWPTHRSLCKPYSTSACLRTTYRRALLFSGTKPRFIFLRYAEVGAPLDILHYFFDIKSPHEIKKIAFHDHYLPYWIQLRYDSNPDGKRSLEKNEAIGAPFRGPVVAIAYDAEKGLSKPALDVDTTTLRPVMEYAKLMAGYGGPIFVEQPQVRYSEKEFANILKKKNPLI